MSTFAELLMSCAISWPSKHVHTDTQTQTRHLHPYFKVKSFITIISYDSVAAFKKSHDIVLPTAATQYSNCELRSEKLSHKLDLMNFKRFLVKAVNWKEDSSQDLCMLNSLICMYLASTGSTTGC